MTPADLTQLTTDQLGVLAKVAQRTAARFNKGKRFAPVLAAEQQRVADRIRKAIKEREQ